MVTIAIILQRLDLLCNEILMIKATPPGLVM